MDLLALRMPVRRVAANRNCNQISTVGTLLFAFDILSGFHEGYHVVCGGMWNEEATSQVDKNLHYFRAIFLGLVNVHGRITMG